MSDEELQEHIEGGDLSDTRDANVYRLVFSALRKEPAFRLPATFADRVLQRVTKADQPNREIAWLLLGLFSFVVALGIAVYLTGFTPGFGAFAFVSSYPGLFVFALLFIGLLQWVDKRMIQRPTATNR